MIVIMLFLVIDNSVQNIGRQMYNSKLVVIIISLFHIVFFRIWCTANCGTQEVVCWLVLCLRPESLYSFNEVHPPFVWLDASGLFTSTLSTLIRSTSVGFHISVEFIPTSTPWFLVSPIHFVWAFIFAYYIVEGFLVKFLSHYREMTIKHLCSVSVSIHLHFPFLHRSSSFPFPGPNIFLKIFLFSSLFLLFLFSCWVSDIVNYRVLLGR